MVRWGSEERQRAVQCRGWIERVEVMRATSSPARPTIFWDLQGRDMKESTANLSLDPNTTASRPPDVTPDPAGLSSTRLCPSPTACVVCSARRCSLRPASAVKIHAPARKPWRAGAITLGPSRLAQRRCTSSRLPLARRKVGLLPKQIHVKLGSLQLDAGPLLIRSTLTNAARIAIVAPPRAASSTTNRHPPPSCPGLHTMDIY
jgi:hypothetical protein